jgi:hypothetical protein
MLIIKYITSSRSIIRSLLILYNCANSKLLKIILRNIMLSILIRKETILFLVNTIIEILLNKIVSTLC